MWVHMGHNWDGMFEFLEASLTPDANTDCAALFSPEVAADTTTTALYLEVRISAALAIQRLRVCTLENASGLMARGYHN